MVEFILTFSKPIPRMYRGFNLQVSSGPFDTDFYDVIGNTIYNTLQKEVKSGLDKFLKQNGHLNGKAMQSNWFPQIPAQVFISHARSDEPKAIRLAGWLYHHFKILSFIDSLVWGYCDDLLKDIDNKYCIHDGGPSYSYEKRNRSTSHVHMMLMTSLNMMIDQAECLMFLNTPNSVDLNDLTSDAQTASPWIYAEISTSQIIRINEPERISERTRFMNEQLQKGRPVAQLVIDYDLSLKHLVTLKESSLRHWQTLADGNDGNTALEALYTSNPLPPNGQTS